MKPLVLLASLLFPVLVAAQERVHLREVPAGDRVVLKDGRSIALAGIRPPGDARLARAARERLRALTKDVPLHLHPVPNSFLLGGPRLGTLRAEKRDLAVRLLEEGLALPQLSSIGAKDRDALEAAARRAKKAGLGVWKGPVPEAPQTLDFHRGVGLGLYSRSQDFDYGPFLDEIRAVHASHVLLIVPWFMEDWQATAIFARKERTASMDTVRRVAQAARKRGLRVSLMPIVLLQNGCEDHWRGDIQPRSSVTWFWNYARLIGRWTDLAREVGASLLCVGSELGSMEGEVDRWRALIRSTRIGFSGRLSYSANWDRYHEVPFWDALDLVGMTAYHSLTKERDPSASALRAGWDEVRDRLLEWQKRVDRPLLFTELGYPSQDGANTDPWNYYLSRDPDWEEQAACFRAAIQSWSSVPAPRFAGAYWYNWWRNDDPDDRWNYSIKGKPAEAVLREHFLKRSRR